MSQKARKYDDWRPERWANGPADGPAHGAIVAATQFDDAEVSRLGQLYGYTNRSRTVWGTLGEVLDDEREWPEGVTNLSIHEIISRELISVAWFNHNRAPQHIYYSVVPTVSRWRRCLRE